MRSAAIHGYSSTPLHRLPAHGLGSQVGRMTDSMYRCVGLLASAAVVLALSSCTSNESPAAPLADPVEIVTSTLADAEVGTLYADTLRATGGDGTFTWTVDDGSVPSGLSLAPAGQLSGTPDVAGTASFTVRSTSGDGQFATRTLNLTVVAAGPLAADESCAGRPGTTVASFQDPALEARVRAALSLGASDTLTCAGLASVSAVRAQGRGITSLLGSQNLTAVSTLELHENAIADITSLSGLTTLETLNLYSNQVADLSALIGLTGLRVLVLWNNPATDLSPLAPLVGLEFLELWGNPTPISDISPLAGMTSLTRLFLRGNAVADAAALAGLTVLRDLDLGENQLTDVDALVGLTALENLWLDGNSALTDLQGLLDNPSLGAGTAIRLTGTAVSCADVATLEARGIIVSSDCP